MAEKNSASWKEVYPNFNGAVALRGARKKEGLTQKDLARLLGTTARCISEMENGKKLIDEVMAKRLGKVLDIDCRVFL